MALSWMYDIGALCVILGLDSCIMCLHELWHWGVMQSACTNHPIVGLLGRVMIWKYVDTHNLGSCLDSYLM